MIFRMNGRLWHGKSIFGVIICLILGLLINSAVLAATMEIAQMPLGAVISINGHKFVKINNNNEFIAVEQVRFPDQPGFANGLFM